MVKKYQIHPAIGVARLGDSPKDFCIAPETAGGLPIECDSNGNTVTKGPDGSEESIKKFRDSEGRIKRQAARFHIYVIDDDHPEGRPLKIGDKIEGGGNRGTLVDIEWRVYVANKKASWYEFHQLEGEHGYAPTHPLRNADLTDSDSRQRLIIDPGPQTINSVNSPDQTPGTRSASRSASFSRGGNSQYAQTFPPDSLRPHTIDTLGDILTDDKGRLLVLGGHGNSGSYKEGVGEPRITSYANNDGWFDDTSDGPVMARLKMKSDDADNYRYIDVEGPAWVICAYPSFVPAVLDMITLEDVFRDVEIREFAGNTYLFGVRGTFDAPQQIDPSDSKALAWWKTQDLVWNSDYYPLFHRDIWPILNRPNDFNFLTNILDQSNAPHDQTSRGSFFQEALSSPDEKHRKYRQYLYNVLRQPGGENQFSKKGRPDSKTHNVPLMPLLCGDNPITNVLPSKFLVLTDTQLFMLRQWADGKFINENEPASVGVPGESVDGGRALDGGVLSNVLGGAFCPGGEVGWIVRNPSIFREPYRIKADPDFYNFRQTAASAYQTPDLINQAYITDTDLSQSNDFDRGLQPGDLTKYMSLPWQSDYNECSTQPIDVTYDLWAKIYPSSEEDSRLADMQKQWITLWWPAHRPMQAYEFSGMDPDEPNRASFSFLDWARGIPQTNEGDFKMVTAWKELGFIVKNPLEPPQEDPSPYPKFICVERSDEMMPLSQYETNE